MVKQEILNEKYDCEPDKYGVDSESQELFEEDDSPIEEIRVTISNVDDPTMLYNTFRMWFLGILWTVIVGFVNQFFYLRQTVIGFGYSVIALLSLPMGHFMAAVLPTHEFNFFGFRFSLNPGPFTIKEHVLIGTMVACNSANAYAVDIIILQKLWLKSDKPFIAGLLLVITTQITGFALAGAIRRFLVRPSHMIWPQTLVTASLFRSLHATHDSEPNRMPRMKYFFLVAGGMYFYYWLPGFIFPTIGVLSWICWIAPNNVVLAQLTGSYGLGIGTIALDWTAISSYVQPLITPWFAQVNVLVGFITVAYIAIPWTYYTNTWNAKNYPIMTSSLYLENGTKYDEFRVLDSRGMLDEAAYREYGPLRMASGFAWTYGVGFAALSATIVHVLLYNGGEIIERWRESRAENDDIHSRLMRVYPEVPDWWYGLLFVITVVLSLVTCIVWGYMPWWALFLAMVISMIFVLPVGIVQAVTNQQPSLNIVTEYVIGYLLPGDPIANVTFKTYGMIVNTQALTFTADLKLGHYMKIPPRLMFLTQLISGIIACVVNLATAEWLVSTTPNICTDEGYPFTCLSTRTLYSASIIWGAIGPARMFGSKDGAIYGPIQWAFLIGALLPLIFWFLSKKFPRVYWLKLVHWPVLLAATANMPPALPYFYSNGLFVGFIFAFLLRRYQYNWWARYNYLTSAALDTGVALSGLVIYFIFQMRGASFPYWWGNPDPSNPDVNAGALDHCYNGYSNFYGQ
ncbi:oligopeptide transporter 2-like protein [Mortierella sp. GBAus27b]|nr:hypothetical protein BGX31_003804 [Mortierella sp. GBA43]KAI8345946.1 oligopeptide transporter 2-like protein [Mortierella sp. GBAus27b]